MNSFYGLPSFNHYPIDSSSLHSKNALLELASLLENIKTLIFNENDQITYDFLSNQLIKIKNLLDTINGDDLDADSVTYITDTLIQFNEKFVLLRPELIKSSLSLLSSLFISINTSRDDLYLLYFNLLSHITDIYFDLDDTLIFRDQNGLNLTITFDDYTSKILLHDLTSLLNISFIEDQFTLFFNLKIQEKSFLYISDFLACYGKNIESLIIDHQVNDDELVNKILLNCESLNNLKIISPKLEVKNLNLQSLQYLQKITLDCEDLTSFDILLPPDLNELHFINCSKLERLPSTIPITLNKIYFFNCINLSIDYKIDYLSSLFKNDFKQALALFQDFEIDDVKLGNVLIQSLPLEQIKKHIELIKRYIPKGAIYPIMVALLNDDLHFFLNHAQGFPLTDIPTHVLNEIPRWVKLNQFKINLLKFNQKKTKVEACESIKEIEEVQTEKGKVIFLNELLTLFDAINFEDSQQADFISEKYLQIDGYIATKEQIREGLEKLIFHVENLANYSAVPKDLAERNIWYQDLRKDLETIISLSKQSSNSHVYPQELIRLGAAGQNCGSRWRKESKDIISVLKNIHEEFNSLSDFIETSMLSYFEAIATEISFQFKHKIKDIMQPHLLNAICKIMKEMKLPLNEMFMDLKDEYINSFSSEERLEIKEKIDTHLIPLRITYFIFSKIQELLTENEMAKEIVINTFNELAERELFSQIKKLESLFEERKLMCGIKNCQTLLNECLVKKAILEKNVVDIDKFKSENFMNFRRISQILAKEQAELEERNKEKEIDNSKKRKADSDLEEGDLRGEKKPRIENSRRVLSLDETILQYQNYITNPQNFESEIKELGHETAAKEMRLERETMVSEYLEEHKFIEVDLIGNVKINLEGILALLKSFNYLVENLP